MYKRQAGVAQGEVGEAIFAVSFFWLGMPWTALLALAPWADLLIQIALVLAVLINLALLHRLGRRAAARARPATVVDTG